MTSTAPIAAPRAEVLARLDRALADIDELVPLDEQRFLDTHAVYEGRSDQQLRIIEWFAESLAPATSGGAFRVLSVGCGSGLLDFPVAARMAEQTGDLHYVGIDPNATQCAAFERRFDDARLAGVRIDVMAGSFEDLEVARDFDVAHFVHCLYYMPDPMSALARARDLLAPGGRLVVFQAPCEELNDLATRFYDKQYARPTLFAEELASALDARGWRYERGRIDARVDVTPFIDGDPEVGLALRDFILQVNSERLPVAVNALVDVYLRIVAVHRDDRSHIAHPVDYFIIDG